MKIKLLAIAAVATFLFACGGGDTPEKVAENFHLALAGKDYGKAKDLATKAGQEQVKQVEEMSKNMGALGGDDKAEKVEIESVKCDEPKDDKTKCTCKQKDGKEVKYDLVKEDGKWKVDYKKLGDMGDMPMDEPVMDEPVIEEPATDPATEEAPVE